MLNTSTFYTHFKFCTGIDRMRSVWTLPQSSVGTKYLDSVFPHRFMARTIGCPSFHDAWNDDKQMTRILDYLISNGRDPNKESIVRNLQFNVHIPSHFFPDSAAALCNRFAPTGAVFDPFTGWGGRALGTICSSVRYFVSTDTQLRSIESGKKLASDFQMLSKTTSEFYHDNFVNFPLLENFNEHFVDLKIFMRS